jgi:hypothetical protein
MKMMCSLCCFLGGLAVAPAQDYAHFDHGQPAAVTILVPTVVYDGPVSYQAPAAYQAPVIYESDGSVDYHAPVVYEAPVDYHTPVVYYAPVYYVVGAPPAPPPLPYPCPEVCPAPSTVFVIGANGCSYGYANCGQCAPSLVHFGGAQAASQRYLFHLAR